MAIDTETTGLNIRDGRDVGVGISLAWGDDISMYLPFGHKYGPNLELDPLKPLLQSILDDKMVIYHHARFDLVSLQTFGLDTSRGNFFCTMLLSHMLDENRYSNSLDACGKSWIGDSGKKADDAFKHYVKKLGWAEVPSLMMNEYAAYDALLTLKLWRHLWPLICKEGVAKNWVDRSKIVRLINSMEGYGVGVDVKLCYEMAEQGHKRMQEIVNELGGVTPSKPHDLEKLLIGELGLPVVKRSKITNQPSFDKEAMVEYEEILEARNNPLARRVLEYRGWQKSTSSNYEPYVRLLSPDGQLRTNFNLNGTVTGRFSSREPNLQQIPRSGDKPWNGRMKQCFLPREGYTLVEVDYSQLEFRLATSYAQVQPLIEVFNDPKRDIFNEMSASLGLSRDKTKTRVYALQYGAGAKRIAHVDNISIMDARRWMDDYYLRYPGFRIASDRAQAEAQRNGRIKLWSGRYRHFQYPSEHHKAFNSLIQGGAADIVEATMRRCSEAGFNDGTDCRMILQIHDAIVFEIRSDLLGTYVPAIKACMSDVGDGWGVKFPVDAHIFGTKVSL